MAWNDGVIQPQVDTSGRLKIAPDPETADTAVQYMSGNAGVYLATQATTTTFITVLSQAIDFVGVMVKAGSEANFGDKLYLEILMADDTPVGNFGPEFNVMPDELVLLFEASTKKNLPSGFKLKLTYTSVVGATVDVPFSINYKYRV